MKTCFEPPNPDRLQRVYTPEEVKLLESMDIMPMNDLQKEAIGIVREAVASELAKCATSFEEVIGDRRILRFLRGHKFNLTTAATHYHDMLVWRRENDMDSIREKIVSQNLGPEHFPYHRTVLSRIQMNTHHKSDKDGRPLSIERTGMTDFRGLVNQVPQEEYIEFVKYEMEHKQLLMDRLSLSSGKLVRMCVIKDLAGISFGLSHLKSALDYLSASISMQQSNYPECVDKVFIINAPWAFSSMWRCVKLVLAERTQQKVNILEHNYLPTLLQHIDASALPVSMGR